MGLMDMLSPFATGFLEKRVEQQDAREKYIAESNKLKDETLAENAKNKKMLLDKYTMDPLSTETKQNSFVVAYEDVDKVNVEDIIDYCNK